MSIPDDCFHYQDGSFLWFNTEEEVTRFLTYFAKRAVAPPKTLLESLPEKLGYDTLDAHLHQSALWPFVSKSQRTYNPALVRAFYLNLRRDGDVIYSMVKNTPIELTVSRQ
ncbi:unnamed protein product [Cuscuta campestris]|uniref:Uncharacterized protein n=1 Tax=Cuscuta campestris TaxID=132261 RepID=A0A484LKU5_9ASTE|nr:unnamed protein product [Cuscuta campestris]